MAGPFPLANWSALKFPLNGKILAFGWLRLSLRILHSYLELAKLILLEKCSVRVMKVTYFLISTSLKK